MKSYYSVCLLLLFSSVFGCSKAPQSSTESDTVSPRIESDLHPLTGIYSIVNQPFEDTDNSSKPVKEIIGDHLEGIEITARGSGRVPREFAYASASESTEKQILELFKNTELEAHSFPIWNIDWDVEIVGTLKYKNGVEAKFAIAGYKVGFQDQTGEPWYFEWEEKYPSKKP